MKSSGTNGHKKRLSNAEIDERLSKLRKHYVAKVRKLRNRQEPIMRLLSFLKRLIGR